MILGCQVDLSSELKAQVHKVVTTYPALADRIISLGSAYVADFNRDVEARDKLPDNGMGIVLLDICLQMARFEEELRRTR